MSAFDRATVGNIFTIVWRSQIETLMYVNMKSACTKMLTFNFFPHNCGKEHQYACKYRLNSHHLSLNYDHMCITIRHFKKVQANFIVTYVETSSETSLTWKKFLLTVVRSFLALWWPCTFRTAEGGKNFCDIIHNILPRRSYFFLKTAKYFEVS